MYDFSLQKSMLSVSLELLKDNEIEDISALGGGTALAAYYWNHRYSTDIDIFIYSKGKTIDRLRPNLWSDKVTKRMKDIGFDGDFKMHPIYTELAIDENSKMQFFDVNNYTDNPYNRIKLWGLECNIESIGEIIAKKIYYRCEKGNARDLFDIALAIHKQPDILNDLNIKQDKIFALYQTVVNIKNDNALSTQYIKEIEQMNPSKEYITIALNTVEYLSLFLENYTSAYSMGIELDNEELFAIEQHVYETTKSNVE